MYKIMKENSKDIKEKAKPQLKYKNDNYDNIKGNIKNNTKGITLIALVITIIVLLILAGVSIATLTGENGILTQANNAKTENEKGEEKESIGIAYNGAKLKKQGEGITDADLNEQFATNGIDATAVDNGDGTITVTFGDPSNRKYTIDENGNIIEVGENTPPEGETVVDGVTIPKGFYYVGGSKSDGLVISDKKEDENKGTSWDVAKTLQGNQFVWVPVENDADFKTYEGYYNGKIDSKLSKCQEPFINGYANEVSEYNAMKNSVLENNGFYVGRYEAGTTSSTERTKDSGITDDVIIKQGANVYNWIGWSNSNDMTVETEGAVEKAKEFDTENGYTTVTSTLIYSVQWDAIMQWIDPGYKNQDGKLTSFVANSTGKGNYKEDENTNSWKGKVAKTGTSADYEVKNIYDLVGNVEEWTMESYNTDYRVTRGGHFNDTGFINPASLRGYNYPSTNYDLIGFRLTLYL